MSTEKAMVNTGFVGTTFCATRDVIISIILLFK